jgi:hypothetical protein
VSDDRFATKPPAREPLHPLPPETVHDSAPSPFSPAAPSPAAPSPLVTALARLRSELAEHAAARAGLLTTLRGLEADLAPVCDPTAGPATDADAETEVKGSEEEVALHSPAVEAVYAAARTAAAEAEALQRITEAVEYLRTRLEV